MQPDKATRRKLEKFRESFRILTADGTYPPDRQSRLFQAAQTAGLNWDEARQYIQADAEVFYSQVASHLTPAQMVDPTHLEELHRLRRRLGLAPMQAAPTPVQLIPPQQVVVTVTPAPTPTWKRRVITMLTLTTTGATGCVIAALGLVFVAMLLSFCMAMGAFGAAFQSLPPMP